MSSHSETNTALRIILRATLGGAVLLGLLAIGCTERGAGSERLSRAANLRRSRAATRKVRKMKSTDGRPLVAWSTKQKVPPRPDDPESLPETETGHWWDMEYAGWGAEKVNIPTSPEGGAWGKDVVLIRAGDHPYWTAYVNGFRRVAEAFNMDVTIYNSNWNIVLQAQQTEQAINQRPDMIIFAPVDPTSCTLLLREINRVGVPVIASNTLISDRAMKYVIAWTGPDDWGQFRMLARRFADVMDKRGGYAIVRHMPGSSPFFARTYAPITTLRDHAPKMELLAMNTANLKASQTMQLVAAWLAKYGQKLEGLILPGDGFSLTGALQAVKSAGREDVTIVAAGSSQTGLQAVKDGDVLGITYQSAEGDGALACFTAAQWFNGKDIPPVRYLQKEIITEKDVDKYLPAQW